MMTGPTVMHVLNSASGGAALSTIALIEKMKKTGISACAVCDDRGTTEERERLTNAVDGKVLFSPLYWWNRKTRSALWKRPILECLQLYKTGWLMHSTRAVMRAARQWHVDLIHTNTLLTPEGGLASRKLGIPHVWHVRELIGDGQPFQLKMRGQALGHYLIRHCERVIANSEITAVHIGKWLPSSFVAVVPNGIDCAAFERIVPRGEADKFVVGMVANLGSYTKKHHLFVKAAAEAKSVKPIEWRIYGHDPSQGGKVAAGEYIDTLHVLARSLGLGESLSFPGHLSPERVMEEIDLLVHPSDVESFGRVVVEAMAAGKPVVAVNGGGVAEIVVPEQTGLLAKPDDPASLARCIERMVTDPEFARRCGEAGRLRAEQIYSIQQCARGVANVYEEVLRAKKMSA
jgi:glycosyltransferase involved in cell wall biosynthesis